MLSRLRTDWFLFAIAAGLSVFGAAMVYSASAMIAMRESQSQFTYFYKQFAFTLIGLGVMFVASKIDYRRYQNEYVVYGILIATAVVLIAVFGFPAINGARRWIRFGGFSFQPRPMSAGPFGACMSSLCEQMNPQIQIVKFCNGLKS